jgi:thiamine pyrophosphate-dependent acetolactate synthase large subunit-like protein
VVGDGSLLMHGMEIRTAVRYRLPIVITVVNNSALGNVYLRALHESPEAVRVAEIPTQDWAAFSRSLGGDGVVVEHPADLPSAFERAFAAKDRPFVVDLEHPEPAVHVEALAVVVPAVVAVDDAVGGGLLDVDRFPSSGFPL